MDKTEWRYWSHWWDGMTVDVDDNPKRYAAIEIMRMGSNQTSVVDPNKLGPYFNIANLLWRPSIPKPSEPLTGKNGRDSMDNNWHVVTVTYGGLVSILKNLDERTAKAAAERLSPGGGPPMSGTSFGCRSDGDISDVWVLGPEDDQAQVEPTQEALA